MACYEVSFCHDDPPSLKSIYRMVQEEMSFEEFKLTTIAAILDISTEQI